MVRPNDKGINLMGAGPGDHLAHGPRLLVTALTRSDPTVAVQPRNDFPAFQATVLLSGHACLVIPGLVPGTGSGTAVHPIGTILPLPVPGTDPGMTKIWDREAISRAGH